MGDAIYISLRNEGTDVWRPVSAERLHDDLYRITAIRTDDTETWEFSTGDVGRCCEQRSATGERGLVAYERVTYNVAYMRCGLGHRASSYTPSGGAVTGSLDG